MSSLINVTPESYTEEIVVENWASEYAKKSICEHKEAEVLDHPNGCVTAEKLSDDLREIISYATEISDTAKCTADRSMAVANSAKEIAEFAKNETVAQAESANEQAKNALKESKEANDKVKCLENEIYAVNSDAEGMRTDIQGLTHKTVDLELMLGDVDAACDRIISIQNNLMGVSE